jgi:hypothetical protein
MAFILWLIQKSGVMVHHLMAAHVWQHPLRS